MRCEKVISVRQVLLEPIILNGAKQILDCSSKACNEAVRGNMSLDTLQSCRDRVKMKW